MSAPILDLKKPAPAAEEQKEEQKGLSNDVCVFWSSRVTVGQ